MFCFCLGSERNRQADWNSPIAAWKQSIQRRNERRGPSNWKSYLLGARYVRTYLWISVLLRMMLFFNYFIGVWITCCLFLLCEPTYLCSWGQPLSTLPCRRLCILHAQLSQRTNRFPSKSKSISFCFVFLYHLLHPSELNDLESYPTGYLLHALYGRLVLQVLKLCKLHCFIAVPRLQISTCRMQEN